MAGGAVADDLSNGVFITHNVPSYVFSVDPPTDGYCSIFGDDPITAFDQQNPQTDLPEPYGADHFFVLAAWADAKEFCAAEFGLGGYDTAVMLGFPAHEPCGIDPLVIPTGGWPGPNEGIAISVAAANAWYGQFVPVYFFAVYGYGAPYSTTIPLIPDPAQDFIGTASCDTPPVTYPAVRMGTFGINEPGEAVEPPPPPEEGACCVGYVCHFVTESACMDLGGEFQGVGIPCEPNPCIPPSGACCVGGYCEVMFEDDCQGIYMGDDTVCDPNPCIAACCDLDDGECYETTEAGCMEMANSEWHPEWANCDVAECPPPPPPTGACCVYEEPDHICYEDVTEDECTELGGYLWEEDTTCEEANCGQYTGTQDATWGTIKEMYR
jgi:hypothetical protein